ncbi:hypothetical protein QYM36_019405 [Artemia franciscana]|uniref:Uncharacterized protein n=1 Tax=Artemia franciscana TaxID=6661 RepID=A0AA88H187_ARTSF|nr:hypothetical protein QYM36_019405 [Artemia franciscana]
MLKDISEKNRMEILEKEADSDIDLDRDFLPDVCEIKLITEREKGFRASVCAKVDKSIPEKPYEEIESSFKILFKSSVSLSSGLQSRFC